MRYEQSTDSMVNADSTLADSLLYEQTGNQTLDARGLIRDGDKYDNR